MTINWYHKKKSDYKFFFFICIDLPVQIQTVHLVDEDQNNRDQSADTNHARRLAIAALEGTEVTLVEHPLPRARAKGMTALEGRLQLIEDQRMKNNCLKLQRHLKLQQSMVIFLKFFIKKNDVYFYSVASIIIYFHFFFLDDMLIESRITDSVLNDINSEGFAPKSFTSSRDKKAESIFIDLTADTIRIENPKFNSKVDNIFHISVSIIITIVIFSCHF